MLADERPARDLPGLQALLNRFRGHDNLERPHQGIDDLTPAERYRLGFELVHGTPPPAAPAPANDETASAPSYPPRTILRKVSRNGELGFRAMAIQVGSRWNGATLRVIEVGELIHIYHGEILVRALVPDRTQRVQALDRRGNSPRPLTARR
jgi:hypothetical protein